MIAISSPAQILGRLRPVGTAALAALVVLVAPGVASARAHRHTPPRCAAVHLVVGDAAAPRLARAVVCLVNREREARGLPRLVPDRRLDHSAQAWTDAMVSTSDFGHGSNFAGRVSAAGFRWSGVAENIAAGYPTPAAVVAGWMASAGHCANILNPGYRDVGTGVNGGAISGARDVWTQDFGTLMGQRAASGDTAPMRGCPYR